MLVIQKKDICKQEKYFWRTISVLLQTSQYNFKLVIYINDTNKENILCKCHLRQANTRHDMCATKKRFVSEKMPCSAFDEDSIANFPETLKYQSEPIGTQSHFVPRTCHLSLLITVPHRFAIQMLSTVPLGLSWLL